MASLACPPRLPSRVPCFGGPGLAGYSWALGLEVAAAGLLVGGFAQLLGSIPSPPPPLPHLLGGLDQEGWHSKEEFGLVF